MNARVKPVPEVDIGLLSPSERELLSKPQRDGDRMAWLDSQRCYLQSGGPMNMKGSWFIYHHEDAWRSGLVLADETPYEEEEHATLREAIDRVFA